MKKVLPLLVCLFFCCIGPGVHCIMKTIETNPEIKPDPEKAVLVVFRSTRSSGNYAINTWIDKKIAGQTAGRSYFIVKVEPGAHNFFGEGGSVTGEETVEMTVNAKKVYYIWPGTYPGPSGLRTGFSASTPEAFAKELPSMHYSEIDPAEPLPVFDEGVFQKALDKYKKELREDPDRYKDTQNILGY